MVVIAAEPSNVVPLMDTPVFNLLAVAALPVQDVAVVALSAVVALVAVSALPFKAATIVAGNNRVTAPEPSTLTAVPVPVHQNYRWRCCVLYPI